MDKQKKEFKLTNHFLNYLKRITLHSIISIDAGNGLLPIDQDGYFVNYGDNKMHGALRGQ